MCHKFTFPAYLFDTNLGNLFYAQKKRRIFSKIALKLYRGFFFHFGKRARSHEFLGHLSHSGDLLRWVGVRRRASSVVRRALTSSPQKLLGQS